MSESLAQKVAKLPAAEREVVLAGLDDDKLLYDFGFWGRPEQLEAFEDYESSIILYLAGRGAGKTRVGMEWVRDRDKKFPGSRFAFVARTAADVRDTLLFGESGLMNICPPSAMPVYEPSKRLVTFPDVDGRQSTALLFSSVEPSLLRGPQHHFAVCVHVSSLVRTPEGEKYINEIRPGDHVLGSDGYSLVRASRPTGLREAVRLVAGEHDLLLTPDHRVQTQHGWTEARHLTDSHFPELCDLCDVYHAGFEVNSLDGGRLPVWDISTESGDFYANGILVHNCDEIATWDTKPDESGTTAWDNVLIGTRLPVPRYTPGLSLDLVRPVPQVLALTTPKKVSILQDVLQMVDDPRQQVRVVRGTTRDNAANLSPVYLQRIYAMYEGTRLERQELEGVLMEDVEGALWSDSLLARNRVLEVPSDVLHRHLGVIAVDPSVAESPHDECGIVVAMADTNPYLHLRHAYVVEDASVQGSPTVWADRVLEMHEKWGFPVLAEVNQGGSLVGSAIQSIDPSVRVMTVSARRGKGMRAEPVAVQYDRGVVHHLGILPGLEAQMVGWDPSDRNARDDRVDALVYAVSALLLNPPDGYGGGRLRARSLADKALATARSAPPPGSTRRLTLPARVSSSWRRDIPPFGR